MSMQPGRARRPRPRVRHRHEHRRSWSRSRSRSRSRSPSRDRGHYDFYMQLVYVLFVEFVQLIYKFTGFMSFHLLLGYIVCFICIVTIFICWSFSFHLSAGDIDSGIVTASYQGSTSPQKLVAPQPGSNDTHGAPTTTSSASQLLNTSMTSSSSNYSDLGTRYSQVSKKHTGLSFFYLYSAVYSN